MLGSLDQLLSLSLETLTGHPEVLLKWGLVPLVLKGLLLQIDMNAELGLQRKPIYTPNRNTLSLRVTFLGSTPTRTVITVARFCAPGRMHTAWLTGQRLEEDLGSLWLGPLGVRLGFRL